MQLYGRIWHFLVVLSIFCEADTTSSHSSQFSLLSRSTWKKSDNFHQNARSAELKKVSVHVSALIANTTSTVDLDEAALREKVDGLLKDALEMKERLGSINKSVARLKTTVGEGKASSLLDISKSVDVVSALIANASSTVDFDEAALREKVDGLLKDALEMKERLASVNKSVARLKTAVGEGKATSMLDISKNVDVVSALIANTTTTVDLDEAALREKVDGMLKDALEMKERLSSVNKSVARLKTAVGEGKAMSMLDISKNVDVVSALVANASSTVALDEAALREKVDGMLKDALEMKERLGSVNKSVARLKTAVGDGTEKEKT